MRALDTNILIRSLTQDDPIQSPKADAFIAAHRPVWVSHLVLVETMWVLESVYDQAKPQLVAALARLLDNMDLALEDTGVVRASLDLYRATAKLNFEDCMILEIARQAGHLPLGTFDKALGKSDGAQQVV